MEVQLDNKLYFTTHLNIAAEKATKTAAGLARLIPNVNGPNLLKRRLLSTVVSAKMLYAAPV